MTIKSLDDPFDPRSDLRHGHGCRCASCAPAGDAPAALPASAETMIDRAVESAIVRAVFDHHDAARRRFLQLVGGGTLAAALGAVLPLEKVKAAVKEAGGPLEKKELKVGFVPITCATPIIMANPMGFYDKHGLKVEVIKTAGWAVARDKSLNGEYDASHMLTPMPLAITVGAGSVAQPFVMPAVENINGQAITLHVKHKDKRDPKLWKGFKFAVPFDYSMHNFLLRYYVAEHGLDPDKDIQIRVVPPPEMVANLRAGNVDGYLAPDPFNQRAVYEGTGFIHLLSKEIWDRHPCCAFAASSEFAERMPNTFAALFRAIVDATHYASKPAHRAEIAKAIAPRAYLNQPEEVVTQVLTGKFPDGLGNQRDVPDRIDFDPFPWHSMGVWILTQMKRWGYLKGDVDYKRIAEQVYLASDCGKVMKDLGYAPPKSTYAKYTLMGKTFDPARPAAYLDGFAIKRV
ncbi:nitrate ABC transporter substrate-binding protein [Sulfurifustis variabilis]|uniref:Nitrate ABC transporter substrate-binding protein n=1 Tax=Sulfurifustis variabilis TaxID=1675686 RepID=A0A1B4V0F7_9GAMM|nr:CmpA/NrtA family ABC transporter substrate-binding protein [Sulfurifustis variabilis]BAU46928.1 nitrate ABC transporter substrate-binding protein [Sulfurifustis variabilis]